MTDNLLLTRDAPVDDLLSIRAAVEPNSFDPTNHTVRVIWSTGAAVQRRDAGGNFSEILSLAPGHVHLDRLNGASVLDTHKQSGVRDIVGTVSDPSTDGHAGHATIRLSSRPDVADIVGDIRDGVIRHLSIGYKVNKWQDSTGPNGGRVRTAVDWEPREISFVAIPADPGAHVRNAPTPDPAPDNRAEINGQIRNVCRTAGLPAEFADSLIDRNSTIEQTRAAAFDEIVRRGVRIPAVQIGASGDDPATLLTRMSAALSHRLGVPGELPEDARQFRPMGLHDMARNLLAARGEAGVLGLSTEALITRAISITDLPALLESTGQRILLNQYQLALSPVFKLARESTNNDFRKKTNIRLGELELLEVVGEGGEVTHGGVGEAAEAYSLATYGKIFSITRAALINDDLGAFSSMSAAQGRAAAETQNNLIVQLLTQGAGLGPTLQTDSVRLFNAAHGNVSSAAGAIALTTLAAGVLAMRSQKGIDGVTPINVVPKTLLVPAALETLARQGVASYYPPSAAAVNTLAGAFEVAVESRLSGLRWYLFADPAIMPVLEYAFLAGAPGPQMLSRAGWEHLGLEFRVILDFGCGALDFRGCYTNAGA